MATIAELLDNFDAVRDMQLAAILRPGDTLVLQADGSLSPDQAEHIKAVISERIGADQKVIILANGLSVGAVHRP